MEVTISAAKSMRAFFDRNPKIYQSETREFGSDPLGDVERYAWFELNREPAHKATLDHVHANGGIFGPKAEAMWEAEELREHEYRPQRRKSICPMCKRVFDVTGRLVSPLCQQCRPVASTWRAPRNFGKDMLLRRP
jgi:hypothetical protein